MKRNYLKGSEIHVRGVVPLEKGGSGADNISDARVNLNLLPNTTIGKPFGLIPIDKTTGVVDASYLDSLSGTPIEVDGPSAITVGTTATYKITNFDSRVMFYVSSIVGTVSIAGDRITYTAPLVPVSGAGFKVNTTFFSVRLITL